MLSNFQYQVIYELNAVSESASVISTENNSKIKDIPVGEEPTSMFRAKYGDMVYVTNRDSDLISVLAMENNTKIKDMPLEGEPTSIAVELFGNIYVVNSSSENITVISPNNFTKIKDIPVGEEPTSIVVHRGKAYVVNSLSDTVSVISTVTNEKVKDIPVGEEPTNIVVDERRNSLYVSNSDSNSISLIDGFTDNSAGGFYFDIYPSNSGYIECDNLVTPLKKVFYVWSGTTYTAIPNKGFEFLSWSEELIDNSTQLINISKSATPLETLKDLFNIKQEEPESTLSFYIR